MTDQAGPQPVQILPLILKAAFFATNHPYAATGIFGAAIGSLVTYTVMSYEGDSDSKTEEVLNPEIYEVKLTREELRNMLADTDTEVRLDLPKICVIVKSENPKQLKQLPVVEGRA